MDHIDNNRFNNNISNLRWATYQENNQNANISKANTSGIKGVSFNKNNNKWRASITIDGVKIHLGYFDKLEDAKKARIERANKAFGVYINSCEK